MPVHFWGEAVTTTVFLLNRAPTKSLDGKTPYEACHGQKPAVGFLKTFGCLGFTKHKRRDDNLGTGTRMIFYPRVAPVPDPNRDGYGTGIFSHPRVTRRVPDTLLLL
jgi:hypothetical protein